MAIIELAKQKRPGTKFNTFMFSIDQAGMPALSEAIHQLQAANRLMLQNHQKSLVHPAGHSGMCFAGAFFDWVE